eukprot:CAMPEP_0177782446 /NCGR_PEP_ID=MMETSP0491_2-20121128/18477_1 /TAXON_ID=63592 /ORGANISM="Tetraselmis chuii, Strain PLY429" /LENGTH=154 /DNA_ID=CAMNT_0019302757 /DNA_START=130 /DNA_END=593 /DNA_ORIENTATION=+
MSTYSMPSSSPQQVSTVHVEDGVRRVPIVGPKDSARCGKLIAVEEVGRVTHGEIVRVENQHRLKAAVEERVGFSGEAANGVGAELLFRHLYRPRLHTVVCRKVIHQRLILRTYLLLEAPQLYRQHAALPAQIPHHSVRAKQHAVGNSNHYASLA